MDQLLFAFALPALLAWQGDVRFPTVKSDNLEGKTFTLPADFGGERNVVFVAFQRDHQATIDTWVPLVKSLVGREPGLEYYEFPVIKRGVALFRWSLNKAMRSGIDDRAARERTITLYLDKNEFRAALGIADESQVHLMIVDRAGTVYWRTTGAYTAEKGAALASALAAARSPQPQP